MAREKATKKSKIGGQAVMEGVMMKGVTSMALAVRDPEGEIRLESKRLESAKKSIWKKIPVIRGVLAFFQSFSSGIKTTLRSAEVFGEEEEPSKFEKWVAEKLKIDVMSVVIFIAAVLGIGLAVGLFVVAPTLIQEWLSDLLEIEKNIWKNLLEGGLRLLIFFAYILLVSLMKDIRRVFQYHGAEHKTINCYEHDKELTVENVRTFKTFHNRCGTTFLFFVMLVSILVFSLLNFESAFVKILTRIALLPVVAGLAFELLQALAKTDSPIFLPLKAPGMLLQKVTTREPDDSMIEVAITAFLEVQRLDEDPDAQPVDTITPKKVKDVIAEMNALFEKNALAFDADAEWIVCRVLNVLRSEIDVERELTLSQVRSIMAYANERATGRPLAYVFGDADFYGYEIKVDERVLIPRPETELLCEKAISFIKEGDAVLDLCTGSGAIATVLAAKTGATVTASDVSEEALSLARENAEANGVCVQFVKSDFFREINGEFDVIVSNPPYIKRADIETLDCEVKNFEPKLALDGGEDGLDAYRVIASVCKDHLKPGGVILFEVGAGQADDVCEMLVGFETEIVNDYAGIGRIVIGRRI